MSSLSQPQPPTDEQKAVLASTARITVVRACPGAGKTEVFVEAIRRRLHDWKEPGLGLAALSFTNIARQTIEARVGGTIPAPHFVGTLDSFVFRFIVKPFGHLVGLPQGGVRLFPASVCKTLEKPEAVLSEDGKLRCPIYNADFCGITKGSPIMPVLSAGVAMKSKGVVTPRRISVAPKMIGKVWDLKKALWNKSGIITHSDCHFLASSVLHLKDHGPRIRQIIANRFPVIFIDELQDTGFFLARTFLSLFEDAGISGLVVGDPNQAIYGFGGASPRIFDEFEKLNGAITLKLTLSQRCPKAVAKVATTLSAPGNPVESLPTAAVGSACLIVHALDNSRLSVKQAQAIHGMLQGSSFAVIARKGTTTGGLRGLLVRDEFQGKSKAARHINIAVQYLVNGEPREAFQIVETELRRVVIGDERAGNEALSEKGISLPEWRAGIFAILASATQTVKGETWNEWVGRVKKAVNSAAKSLRWTDDGTALRSYMTCNKTGNEIRMGLLDVAVEPIWQLKDTISTIHKVKGAEFDTVVFFVPKTAKNKCPSIQWWSDDDGGEERRIAFVAVSRAKQRFVLCLHSTVYDALKQNRPDFIKCFDATVTMLPAT
jgi:DNA helicase-2/ATP-dependent DNA helicase PcrA